MHTAPTAPALAADLVAALFAHGSPSAYSALTDPDTTRSVNLSLGAALDRADRAIGADRARLAAVQSSVRSGVSARSDDLRDERHADRVCAALGARLARNVAGARTVAVSA